MTIKLTRNGGGTKLTLICLFFTVHLHLYFFSSVPYPEWMVSVLLFLLFIYAYVFFSSRTIMEVSERTLKLYTLFGQAELAIDDIERIEFRQGFINRVFDFVTISVNFSNGAVKQYYCNHFDISKGHQFIHDHLDGK